MGRKKKTELIIGKNASYCRKCRRMLANEGFYDATNHLLDTSGKMSVCRDCCNKTYDEYYAIHHSIEDATYATCEDLDIRFSKDVVLQVKSHLEKFLSNGKTIEKVFGVYKSKLGSLGKENENITSFRFRDSPLYEIKRVEKRENEDIDNKLILDWGYNFSIDDLEYLEYELSKWKETHPCDNHAEEILIRELCVKQLEIRKARLKGDPVANKVKELQELMKTMAVDPARAKTASAGKSHEAFSMWLKDIENLTPAEWYDQQEKYSDVDGLKKYLENYVVRPIRNFLTGTRNFIIDENLNTNIDDSLKSGENNAPL